MNTKNLKKIVKNGYSFLVSLPIFWVDSLGLGAGDYVEYEIGSDKNSLTIKFHKKEEVEEASTVSSVPKQNKNKK